MNWCFRSTKMSHTYGKKGQTLHSQCREMVAKISNAFKEEAAAGHLTIPLNNVRQRVITATGISEKTYKRIMKESKENEQAGTSFSTPHKKRPRKSPKCSLSVGEEQRIRQIVYDFYLTEKRCPTLKGMRIIK